jgi:hypothetical protein
VAQSPGGTTTPVEWDAFASDRATAVQQDQRREIFNAKEDMMSIQISALPKALQIAVGAVILGTAVQIVVWLMIMVIGRLWLAPWWLWSSVPAAAIVAWMYRTHQRGRNSAGESDG